MKAGREWRKEESNEWMNENREGGNEGRNEWKQGGNIEIKKVMNEWMNEWMEVEGKRFESSVAFLLL